MYYKFGYASEDFIFASEIEKLCGTDMRGLYVFPYDCRYCK